MHPYDRHVGRYGGALAAGLIEVAGCFSWRARPGRRLRDRPAHRGAGRGRPGRRDRYLRRCARGLWAPFGAGVGHSGTLYASLPPEQKEAVRADAYRRLGSPVGEFRLTARVRTIRGGKG